MNSFIAALNTIKSNIWAFLLILLGAGMVLKGHENIGGMLVTGSFAIIKTSADHGNGDSAKEIK